MYRRMTTKTGSKDLAQGGILAGVGIEGETRNSVAVVGIVTGDGFGDLFKRLGTQVALVDGLGLFAPEIGLGSDHGDCDPTTLRGDKEVVM
jgi:hypothetical protein